MTGRRILIGTAAALGCLVVAGWVVHHVMADPGIVLLTSDAGGAAWVRPDRPFDMGARQTPTTAVTFETTVTVPPAFAGATVTVTALKRFALSVDDHLVYRNSVAEAADWKAAIDVPLPAGLAPGRHRLQLVVGNRYGPALVRVRCDALHVRTGDGAWRARGDGSARGPAVPTTEPWRPPVVDQWGASAPAVGRHAVMLMVLFAAGAAASVAAPRRWPALDWGRWVRWGVLAAWVLLGVVDLTRVPLVFGYDAQFHYDYIQFVAEHAALPPPDTGVQFFQAPLYYVVSAVLWRSLAAAGVAAASLPFLVRVVPLACGAGLAEACYRAARQAFPGRTGLHAVAVVVGGLVPVNLYMGLAVSNEPAAGVAGGFVAVVGMRLLARPADAARLRWWAVAGGLLGVAVLTKVSAGLWAAPLVAVAIATSGGRWRVAAARAGLLAAVAVVVCGPYLVRTWRLTGSPLITHTVLRSGRWWQDPGYRTPANLLTFGRGLTRVAYGGVDSAWDSLYGTVWANGFLSGVEDRHHDSPWNVDLMACGQWLALWPTALVIAGVVAGRVRGGRWFPASAVGLFGAAVVWVYLTLPIYSCAKGSYLLSTAPCAAALAAAGFDRLTRHRWPRAIGVGLLTCWAVTSFGAYLVGS